MSSTDRSHCASCGAAFKTEAERFCPYCGTQRPSPEEKVVATSVAERFEIAEHDPEVERLMALEPGLTAATASDVGATMRPLVACIVLVVISIAFASNHAGILTLFPLAMAGIVLFKTLKNAAGAVELRTATTERSIARVADERTEVRGANDRTHTTYFVTLESKDGARREYRVDAAMAGRVAPNDLGVAYVRADRLLDFRRVNA